MKIPITLSALLFSLLCCSQQYTLPSKLVEKYSNNANKDVIIQTSLDKDDFYEVTLKYIDASKSFKLKPLTFPSFEVKFKDALIEVVNENNALINGADGLSKDSVQNEISYVFTQMITYYNTQEAQPEVATIMLQKEIPIYMKKTNRGDPIEAGINLENVIVEISFFGGFIEKIQVNGTVNNIPTTFNNKYSIGISSTKNIRELSDNLIYSNESFDLELIEMLSTNKTEAELKKFKKDRNQRVPKKGFKPLLLYVDDIIRYIKKVDVNANDISPVPQLVILDKNQTETKLHREESSKIFEAVVYTDFLGVFDEANPNGIIQTEVNKKFNLNTRRHDVRWFNRILFPPSNIFEGIGYFQSFNAQFQFSKIEKNNKFLLRNNFEIKDGLGAIVSTTPYYSPISLFQYRNFAIGGMLNFLTLENQNAKLNMFFDLGFLFGRTGIKETEAQEEGTFVNNLEIPIELKLQILPEKRISFSISDKLSWFETFDSNIPLQSVEEDMLVNKNRFLNSFNVDLALDVSSSGKLFLRYKLIHELDDINNNFSQLQFGYSFYLLQKNGVKRDD